MGNEESLAMQAGSGGGTVSGAYHPTAGGGSFSQQQQQQSQLFNNNSNFTNMQMQSTGFRSQSASVLGGNQSRPSGPNMLQGFHHVPAQQQQLGISKSVFPNSVSSSPRMANASMMNTPFQSLSSNIPGKISMPVSAGISSVPPAAAPAVDLSGLTEEEKRQIAAVMQRAQAQESEVVPSFKPPPFPASKQFTAPSSSLSGQTPATTPFQSLKNGMNNNNANSTSVVGAQSKSIDPLESLRMPVKVTGSTQQAQPLNVNQTKTTGNVKPIPKLGDIPTNEKATLQEVKARAFGEERERLGSWSISSEGSFSSQDSGPALESAFLTTSGSPTSAAGGSVPGSRPKMAGSEVEKCPICQQTELKIVTVHGKPQPLIGQLCARCSLIVCSKCGKVKKGSENKAYWICSRCVNIPWEPPVSQDPDVIPPQSEPHTTYVAPLTHLVTADDQVHSDILRSSAASFFDKPEYALSKEAESNRPESGHEHDHWDSHQQPPSYDTIQQGNFRSVPASPFQPRDADRSLFQQIADEPIVDLPQEELQPYDSYQDYAESPKRTSFPPLPSAGTAGTFPRGFIPQDTPVTQRLTTFSNNTKNSGFSPNSSNSSNAPLTYTDAGYWQRSIPAESQWEDTSMQEPYLDDINQFPSQDSLVEIQEEETSDYGSQIQAACSDIASLSSSTSGGDFGVQKSFSAPVSNANWSEHHSEKSSANNGDNGKGAALRRSHLVENFRSVPTSLSKAQQKPQSAQQNQVPVNLWSPGNRDNQQPNVIVMDQIQHDVRFTEGNDNRMKNQITGGNSRVTGGSISSGQSVPSTQPQQRNQQIAGSTNFQAAATPLNIPNKPSSNDRPRNTQNPTQPTGSNLLSAASNNREPYIDPMHQHQQQQLRNPPQQQQQHHSQQGPSRSQVQFPQNVNQNTTTTSTEASINKGLNTTQPHNTLAQHHHHDLSHTHQSGNMIMSNGSGANNHLKRLVHQSSRDEQTTSELDDFDSALESTTDGHLLDFDTFSQSSQFSLTSTATFPLSSSMTGLNKDERRAKRRLPLLPKDDQAGYSITPEERERQKKELKRRLSGNLLKLTGSESSLVSFTQTIEVSRSDGPNSKTISASTAIVQDWSNDLSLANGTSAGNIGAKLNGTGKVVKRKKHKHLPQTPQDSPKVQLLKQQLRALAARKAGHGDDTNPSFFSLPNNPVPIQLNRFKSISGEDVSSSNEYLTDTTLGSIKNVNVNSSRYYHTASDPALFRSVLEQYRKAAREESRERENAAVAAQWNTDGAQINSSRPISQYHSDPEIQDIVSKLQQINRDIAETKELFRSTSSLTLGRRGPGPRWRSEADLAGPKWHRETHFLDDNRRSHPLNYSYQDNPLNMQRFWQEGYDNDYDYRSYQNYPAYGEYPYDVPFGPPFIDGIGIRQDDYWDDPSITPMNNQFFDGDGNSAYMHDPMMCGQFISPQWSPYQTLNRKIYNGPMDPEFSVHNYPFNIPEVSNNEDLNPYEPFDDPNFLPMGPGAVISEPIHRRSSATSSMKPTPKLGAGMGLALTQTAGNGPLLDAPLLDSRVSFDEDPGTSRPIEGATWEEEKENLSEAGSDGMDATASLSRSMSQKKPKKDSNQPKYPFPTKRILLTRDPKDRSVSGNGLGVKIAGGKLIPNTNTLAAFISKIYDQGIMATLGEVKEGDQVLEWNGVSLLNKSYEEVQEVLDNSNGEVELLLRCDYNVRDLEAGLEEARLARRASHQAEKVRIREYDNGDRSPLPGRSMMFGGSQRKQDGKADDGEEIVYRPSNQLAPPSPGIMQRKKSTTSSGHAPVTGDVMLRMTYERCTLTLQVIKARNLKPADKSGFSDPYCKLSLVPGRASEYKYRTRHVMQTLNPEWKETFTFQSIDPNEIHHKQIEITVWDWDRLSADDFLGEVIVDLADPVHLDGTKRWYPLGERRPGATDDG